MARRAAAVVVLAVALPGCSLFDPASRPIADGITVLAKVDGFGPARATDGGADHAVLEIAHDDDAARAAWAEVVPEGLPERSGDPRKAGRYGSLDDVDLEEQVLVVYSGEQSSTCPGWLGDVSVDDDRVRLEGRVHAPGGACTADALAYRLVLAVDRGKVPAEADLPVEEVLLDGRDLGGLVSAYPAG